jgi:predicted MPP superfamily phosphohydrolase
MSQPGPLTEQDILARLEQRLGRLQARQRLDAERDQADVARHRINFYRRENWYSIQAILPTFLKLTGLYRRGQKNTERIAIRHNCIVAEVLPANFEGFTILQLSDLHADINPGAMRRLAALLAELNYDICVLTGDYRGEVGDPFEAALESMGQVRTHLKRPVYGVLGDHDTIGMIPALEEMGIRMLINESDAIVRDDQRIYLAGIDDARYYHADDIAKTASGIPHGEFSILLSHTPEIYREAAQAGFNVLLSGHTHGGQICLPGSIPITLDSALPRRMGAGPWKYGKMQGYTSVGVGSSIVVVRFNCPPEITLHHLKLNRS